MRIRSLRALIVGSLLAIHVAITAVFLLVANELARGDQREFADSTMRGTVENVTGHTLSFLDRLERVALLTRGLAEAEIVRTEQFGLLERYFFEVLRANPEITGVYYGTVGGDFVFVTREAPGVGRNAGFFSRTMARSDGAHRSVVRLRERDFGLFMEQDLGLTDPFDPRERPWFRLAMRAEGVIWTQPYIFHTAGTPGISTGTKVLGADGRPTGVVGADVSLANVQSFAAGLQVGRSGYAFLLDPRGRAISHPALDREGAVPLASLEQLGDPVLAELAGRLIAGDSALAEPVVVAGPADSSNLVMAQRLPTKHGDWTIGAVVPEADLFGWFRELTRSAVLLALGLTVFWCLAGLLLWRYIDRRFENLRTLAEQVLSRAPERAGRASSPGVFTELEETEAAVEGALTELDEQRRQNLELLEQARRSDRAKTLFLASMSHELRTPLNAIGGFAEIIERQMLGPVGVDKYREYAELIGRSNHRMLELVQNLLDASALEFGIMELHPEPADLDRLTLETVEEQRLQASRRGLTLHSEAASGLTARVDGPKLRVLLANLLRNALAYTPPGGRVEVRLRRSEAGEPEFLVSDTGVGMDPARLDQLRQPFARGLEDSYVAGETGAGLGLSIVDRIAALHRARLAFETAPGVGTRVRVTLPADCVLAPEPATGR